MTTLTNQDASEAPLTATFSPEEGMNLLSYKRGNIECIDQSTRPLFEERFAGLGALIGPHFHHRTSPPLDFDTSLFPHITSLNTKEPFSHGIGRYAPWKFTASSTSIQALLSGDMEWNTVPLRTLQGFDFEMHLDVRLLHDGLFYKYSVTSDKPSVIGLHTYYASDPQSNALFDIDGKHANFPLNKEYDDSIIPSMQDNSYRAILENKTHSVHISYLPTHESDFSWQLYRPEEASFTCIEPLSSRSPRNPTLLSSTIEVRIEIL